MHFSTFVFLSSVLFTHVVALPELPVTFDLKYDNPEASVDTTSCAGSFFNNPNLRGIGSFGGFPQFPNIGGAALIEGPNSSNCGTCWFLGYNGRSINVLAIDHADTGFRINLDAMNVLTDGQALTLGNISAQFTQLDPIVCGIQNDTAPPVGDSETTRK